MSQFEIPLEILRLPVEDRLLLVGKIWDSISAEGFPPLSQAMRQLIDRRISEADANPAASMPATDVFAELGRKD